MVNEFIFCLSLDLFLIPPLEGEVRWGLPPLEGEVRWGLPPLEGEVRWGLVIDRGHSRVDISRL